VTWRLLILLNLISLCSPGQSRLPPIGLWREHLPYHSAVDVTASDNKVYCATPFSLFSVDLSTNEVERISKVAGLSETGISTIRYNPLSKKLLVTYTNSNIDLIDEKGIHNIPDLKRENSSGDKTIYHIFPDGNRWYLSTGIGVVVVDGDKPEIRDSWFIGSSGNFIKTNTFTKNNNFFYAATDEGLKKISTTNNNPADFSNWQNISGANGLSSSACKSVVNFSGKTIALQNDSLFAENGNSWNLFFANGWPVLSITISENKLFVCQRQQNGKSQVLVLGTDGSVQRTIQQNGVTDFPQKAITVNNTIWIADLYDGLSKWTGNHYETYKLNSPEDVATGRMTAYNNAVYVSAGSVNNAWNYQYNRAGVFKLGDGNWTNYNQFNFPLLDTLMDFITVAVDPRDESVWAGSYGGGLLHIKKDGKFEIFKQNSPIKETVGDPGSYRVSGLAFDANNNLWVSNFGSNLQLHVLKKDESWKSFSAPFPLSENAAGETLVDDANQKWIVSPKGNGLIVFNDNNTIDNTSDDKWKIYKQGNGLGNLPSNEVLSIAKDKSGFIWIGTTNGICVIQCPQDAVTRGCDAIWPVINEGSFANYLFKGQDVRSIAIDGADRKWIATSNGVWLMNADGDKVIEHFTEQNSPLLSSDVKSIAVNGATGEVFFATAKGISSFRGTATNAEATKNNVLVFPNPVPPAYNGNIGIRGMPENSVVKITETNGRLVYQTRSLGGQAVWNGKDYKGRQASSGIYLVIAEDENKQEKVVAKIVFISK
jgi:hypothetical protein